MEQYPHNQLTFCRQFRIANDNTGQQISKKLFVSVMNILLIYLFASVKLEKGHKKSLGSRF